jgi:parallel beta-helix repeat protein
MKKIVLLSTVFILSAYSLCWPTIINIPVDYPTIQYGINASSDGDTVLVHPGTYVENVNFDSHNIVLGSLFLTTGDTSYISQTIIDGDSAGTVVTISYNLDTTAVLAGFTIQNGSRDLGGGVYSRTGTIRNNIITGNFATFYGAGILCDWESYSIIVDNVISNNVALESGGGICFDNGANGMVSNNTIVGNSSSHRGGGIAIIAGGYQIKITGNIIDDNNSNEGGGGIFCYSTEIVDNIITGNYSTSYGGGIYCLSTGIVRANKIAGNSSGSRGGGIATTAAAFIENNIIDGNSSNDGGGIACWSNTSPSIKNNIIRGNSANRGGGFYCGYNSSSVAINCIVWGNTANNGNQIYNDSGTPEFVYCDIQDTIWPGAGNISVDPLFRDPADGDFHLMSTACSDPFDSPCIDAGSVYSLDTLLDCSWGLGTFAADMGAYGGGDSTTGNNVVINVPGDYPTIQQAINACNDGDTVLVQPATYYENINFNGHNIVVGSMFIMTGDDSYISSTIIDGSDSASVVTFDSGEDTSTRLIGFTIQNGWGNHGGGIYCDASNPEISNNIISNNAVNTFGGGILILGSSPIISNNKIIDNSANQGGGISCMASSPTILNNLFTGNTGSLSGGGIYCNLNSDPVIINTILWGDNAPSNFEIAYDNTSSPSVTIDPLFRDPSGGDFHLKAIACGDNSNSPCIDAGDPNIPDGLLDCSWGLGTILSDMGAYGGGDSIQVGIEGRMEIPVSFSLSQNYPNPFNAQTTIQYLLSEPSVVIIEIYDILGRRAATFVQEKQQAGRHSVVWDAGGYSSGMYFYRIQAGEYSETKKMLLLK